MKLALGTVQFGLNYGIANQRGQISREDAKAIVNLARQAKVDTLDTAIAYGESEYCLGELGVADFKVVTKLPSIPDNLLDVAQWIEQQTHDSLARLGVSRVYGLLLHRSQQLVGSTGIPIIQALESLKASGCVEKIGVSIYAPDELETVIQACSIDLIQAPMSLLDRRLEQTGWLSRLKELGIQVHARSVFLQGLLLMQRKEIPDKFAPWQRLWARWYDWLDAHPDISPAQACIDFVSAISEVNRIVVGVDSVTQFKELLDATQKPVNFTYPDLACTDEMLLHPSNWVQL